MKSMLRSYEYQSIDADPSIRSVLAIDKEMSEHKREYSSSTVTTVPSTASYGGVDADNPSSSRLSDMYEDAEYFCDAKLDTPPACLSATPPTTTADPLSLPPAAAQSPPQTSSSSNNNNNNTSRAAPVLYSAIGSLEDPSANSLSRYHRNKSNKFEFPSTRLLPPANTKKKHAAAAKAPPPPNNLPSEHSVETHPLKKPSNLKKKATSEHPPEVTNTKKVTIAEDRPNSGNRRQRKKKGPTELFRPSSDAYTPRMGKKQIKYKPAEMRTPVQKMASPLGTLQRPNFRDALRRVAMILHQHVVKIERRFEAKEILADDGLFREDMRDVFSEDRFVTPTYRCTMVRVPMARPGMVYGLKRIRQQYKIPSEAEIYEFAHRLFKTVQLSSECSIVCLIYVERLMETAKVPLLSSTWRPIFMCGLLLASKVWQDLSSWNIEFASVYPQYSLDAINRLELQFLRLVKWDLYISSSAYAKYYFALRSLVEKPDFRQRYNRMVGGVDSVQASEALKIEKRSSMVKEEALTQISRSM